MIRRKFMTASATTAGVAAVAAVGGEMLTKKQPVSASSAPMAANSAAPKSAKASTSPAAAAKPKGLPDAPQVNDIEGLSAFFTPNKEFYRVDTTLLVPKLSTAGWQLKIHGMVDKPITINYSDLSKMDMLEHDVTLTCVSESVGGGFVGNARWTGTLLAPILRQAGLQSGAQQIVMRDGNGMTIGAAVDPIMDGRNAMLAIGMNGEPLPAEHGFPVRVVVPGIYGYVSACKWVVDMEVTTFGAFTAYWSQRSHGAWSQQAPIKTESRIDVPKKNANVKAGMTAIAGVAWAQHTGIAGVEVSTDGGRNWHEAKLPAQDTIDTWRQWYYMWDAAPGQYTIMVRATNKAGYTQTSVKHRTEPNGATGYHTINVTVA
jgi:DMSO/TMAO reductase YedYZ molybdopterin-dependent catalytic subunit